MKGSVCRESDLGTSSMIVLKMPYACAKSYCTDAKQLIQSYSSAKTTVLPKHKWEGERHLRHNRAPLMVPVVSVPLAGKEPHQMYFKICIFLIITSPCNFFFFRSVVKDVLYNLSNMLPLFTTHWKLT